MPSSQSDRRKTREVKTGSLSVLTACGLPKRRIDSASLRISCAPFSAARDYGWSRQSRERMRAQTAESFTEAQQLYEALIARVATKRPEEE